MMKIIGHRGAAGLALENSHDSIAAALQYNLAAIEFDVHLTADGQIVVVHDAHTKRVAEEKVQVKKITLKELQKLALRNKQTIPTLDDVLTIIKSGTVIIDIKAKGIADALPAVLKRHPTITPSFASFNHDELRQVHKLFPEAKTYVLEHFSPIEIIHTARRLHATGIGLNKWLMNPLSYRLARRYNLEFYVYTLNNRWLAQFYQKLYPEVAICTDHPERFAKRKRKLGTKLRTPATARQK
jgi:glycerophosphoryl diester phosphodiesterase